jgi:hypothetical protein
LKLSRGEDHPRVFPHRSHLASNALGSYTEFSRDEKDFEITKT